MNKGQLCQPAVPRLPALSFIGKEGTVNNISEWVSQKLLGPLSQQPPSNMANGWG